MFPTDNVKILSFDCVLHKERLVCEVCGMHVLYLDYGL